MKRRGVSAKAIESVLENYDTRHPARPLTGAKPAEILSAVYEGRRLRVYIERDTHPPKVKTVAWMD